MMQINLNRPPSRVCCRLCLAPENECVSIFTTSAADKEPLSSKINACVRIKVSQTFILSINLLRKMNSRERGIEANPLCVLLLLQYNKIKNTNVEINLFVMYKTFYKSVFFSQLNKQYMLCAMKWNGRKTDRNLKSSKKRFFFSI